MAPVTADPAMQTNASPSRLPHLAKRMEDRGGFIRREPGPADGRFTNAAPGTSPSCAIWVVDAMSPERLGRPGKTPIGSSHPALTR
ncbi:MAG TPA: hypothetical protein VF940_00750 [Streptosporangiaceae bacterium]